MTRCDGSKQQGVAEPGSVYPHCPACGRDFGAQGRKAAARLGNCWKSNPVHYVAVAA